MPTYPRQGTIDVCSQHPCLTKLQTFQGGCAGAVCTLAFQRQRQEDDEFEDSPGLHGKTLFQKTKQKPLFIVLPLR